MASSGIRLDLGDYAATQWTIEQGLPTNVVRGLARTPDGYLWIATLSGLVRYDGVDFKVFDLDNTPELGNAQVGDVLVDERGRLWLHTYQGGLVYRDGEMFRRAALPPGVQVNHITRGGGSGIWAATVNGLYRFCDGSPDTLVAAGRIVLDVLALDGGRTWFATRDSLFLIEAGRVRTIAAVEPTPYGRIYPGPGGGVVHCGPDRITFAGVDSVASVPVAKGVDVDLRALLDPNPRGAIPSARTEADGQLWLGLTAGLVRLEGDPFTLASHRPSGAELVLPRSVGGEIQAILGVEDGSLWIASENRGLFRITQNIASPAEPAWGGEPHLVLRDQHCPLLLGFFRDRAAPVLARLGAPGLEPVESWPLARGIFPRVAPARDGGFWVPHQAGLFRYRDGVVTPVSVPDSLLEPGARVFEDMSGTLWWGVNRGVYRLDTTPPIRVAGGLTIGQTSDGAVWFASDGALSRWDGASLQRFTVDDGLPRGFIRDLWQDPAGRVWLATHGSGLACLDDGRFRVCSTANGLPDNTVGGMLADDDGRLWVNSNRGIFVVEKPALDRFANGDVSHLPCRLVTHDESGSAWASPGLDGRLYFHSLKGIVAIAPAMLPATAPPADARIEGLRAAETSYPAASRVRLPRGTRDVAITYTAPTLSDPDLVRFQTRMLGLSNTWVDVGTRREMYHAHLPPGHYVFEVRAVNAEGDFSPRGDGVEIVVPPEPYETLWFRGAAGLLAGWVVVALYRYRTRVQRRHLAAVTREAERRRQAEIRLRDMGRRLMDAQEDERRRIARDLHDDVNQRLAVLAMELDMMDSGVGRSPAELAGDVQRLSSDVHRLSHALHPSRLEQMGLVRGLQGLRDELSPGAAPRITLRTVELPDSVPPLVALCIFRIAQEAIRNAMKYSGSDVIRVSLDRLDGRLVLAVEDSGQGFDPGDPAISGLGLTSMAERAGAAGGRVRITSAPGKGTTIQAEIPLDGESGT